MSFGQNVFTDESVKVDVHVLEHEVDIPVVLGLNHFLQLYDVMVAELS